MSSANTISIRLEVQGTPETIAAFKSVLTGVNGLEAGLNKAKATMSGGFRTDALQGLSSAIGTTEKQATTLGTRLKSLGTSVAQNGAAFGVATASVWGIYNAYDSLVKVEIRAEQAQNRVATSTTTLRTLEERLTEARMTGNLTAEEMAILEQRITDTKAKLATAQIRSADLQGDVNEAWGAFVSQIGPQVIAAAGSIAQLVTNMRGSLTGVLPRIRDFVSGIGSSVVSMTQAKSSSLLLQPALGGVGPAGAIAATGVRALSGAIKGLLIGTGIGALVVGLGLLLEALGVFNQATATTADETVANFEAAGEGPAQYTAKTQKNLDMAAEIIRQHGENVAKGMQASSAAYVKAVIEQMKIDMEFARVAAGKAKIHHDALQAEIDVFDKKFAAQDRNNLITNEEMAQWKKLIPIRDAAAQSLETSTQSYNFMRGEVEKLEPILTNLTEKEKAQAQAHQLLTTSTGEMGKMWSNTFASMNSVVDEWISKNQQTITSMEGGNAAAKAWAKGWVDVTFGAELNSAALDRVNNSIDTLLPTEEKQAKSLEKEGKLLDELTIKIEEMEKKYGVDIPNALITSDEQLQAFTQTLDENKKMIDEWRSHAEEFKNVATAAKAFKIEFEMEKEVKDFIKDLPKETEKKVKIVMKREQGVADFKKFFEEIKGLFFRQFETTNASGDLVMTMGFRPIYNQKDAEEFRDQLLDQLEDMFGKDAEKGGVWAQKLYAALESAETKEEIIKALQDNGLLIENELAKSAEKAAANTKKAFTDLYGPLGSIAFTGVTPGQEGKVTKIDPKTGKQTIEPVNQGGGDTKSQIADQTALQVALQKTQTAFANLAQQGSLSLAMLAKASSANMTGMKNNLAVGEGAAGKTALALAKMMDIGNKALTILAKSSSTSMSGMKNNFAVAESAAQKLQTGLANLSNQGSRSLMALAQASSRAMNGLINNVNKGKAAVASLQAEINALKSKTVTLTTKRVTKNVNAQHGFHGLVSSPTNFTVGEGFKPEIVTVTPLTDPNSSARNITLPPVSMSETITNVRRNRSSDTGPRTIHLEMPIYLFPGGDVLKRLIKEIPLGDTGMFATA